MFFKKRKRKLTKAVPFVLKNAETNKYVMAKKKANGVYEYIGSDTTDIASATMFSPDATYAKMKIANLPEGTYTVIETKCYFEYTSSANQTKPRSKLKEYLKEYFSLIACILKLFCLVLAFILSIIFISIFFFFVLPIAFRLLFGRWVC